ncbi:MAG TPA: TlpA disulfide reductase family protein [Polyangia bacterium]|nr:TlpA disulfide reductase family protein [Polyangia bacterium]
MLPALLPAIVLAAATSGSPAAVEVNVTDLAGIRAAVAAPGATAVLVTIWATWCDACRDEMPALLRFFHAHQPKGLRLILVSADDEDQRDQVALFLRAAGAQGAQAFIKQGDNETFVNAFDPSWTGAIPASFLYDSAGVKQRAWSGAVTPKELEAALRKVKKPTKGKP